MSDIVNTSEKNIIVEWLTPAVDKISSEVDQRFAQLESASFANEDARAKSAEKKYYDNALEIYEVLQSAQQSLKTRLNVYGYVGEGFMESLYQAIKTQALFLPKHYYAIEYEGNTLPSPVGVELQNGAIKLLEFFDKYSTTEGNQFLDNTPYNVPKGKDPTTYTYRQAFADLESTSKVNLKKYTLLNPTGWWKQQSSGTKSKVKVIGGASILILLIALLQLRYKNVKISKT